MRVHVRSYTHGYLLVYTCICTSVRAAEHVCMCFVPVCASLRAFECFCACVRVSASKCVRFSLFACVCECVCSCMQVL